MINLKDGSIADKFNEYATFVLKNGYVYDLENKDTIDKAIEIFEKNELGIMIVGNSGSGKTLFFDMIQKILHPTDPRLFQKINTLDVVLKFNSKEVGHGVFRLWNEKNVFFDDLGTEDKGYLFGEKVEVFEKFIQFRYDLFHSRKIKTHYTTNLSKDQLNERYGIRCMSRLNEMCERIVLGGKSDYTDRRVYKNFIELPPVFHAKIYSKEDIEFYKNYEAHKKRCQEMDQPQSKGLGELMREKIG